MTLRSLIILVAALAIAACSKSDDKNKAGDDKTAAPAGADDKAAPPAPAEPYAGPLDEARLQKAKDGVKPFQKWDAANAHLMATVGAPHETEGSDHFWYLLDGDKCHELQVENANGEVGAVGLGVYDKAMKSKYDKCLAHSGGDADDAVADDDKAAADAPPAVKKKVMKVNPAAAKGAAKTDDKAGDDDDDEGGW